MKGTSAHKFTEFSDDMNRILNYEYRSPNDYKWVTVDNFPRLPRRILRCLV
tara:strand:- start:497 stop:649 length:153 start_codon:yes stop_codon:yes gene_type:complete